MEGPLERFYGGMVDFQKKHLWPSLFVIALITGFMLFFALQLEVNNTLDQQLKPEDDFRKYREVLALEFEETESFFVVIRTEEEITSKNTIRDLRDPAVINAIDIMGQSVLEEPEVKQVNSIATVFKQAFGRLPNSLEESKSWAKILGEPALAFYKKDMSATLLTAGVNIPDPQERKKVEARIQDRVNDAPLPIGIFAAVTGLPTLITQIIDLMIRDSLTTLGIALIAVFIVLLYLYKRVSLALITVTPVAVAIVWLAGTMTLLGIQLSFANATVAAMVIGLGVDYAIHMTNSFDTKVKKGVAKPISTTTKIVGSALFISFLTTLVGFSVNMLASTEGLRIQGLTLALGVTFAFIATMVLIPILLKLKIEILREEHGVHKWR